MSLLWSYTETWLAYKTMSTVHFAMKWIVCPVRLSDWFEVFFQNTDKQADRQTDNNKKLSLVG